MSEMLQRATGANENCDLEDSFTARIEMLSDWHIGAGFGRPGNIDSLVQRDADNLPFVPAKTLTGIWRDALERLIYALDKEDAIGAWSKWVDFLFGNQPASPGAPPGAKPQEARLEIKPAYLPELLRARLRGKKKKSLRDALTFIKPGVQIEDASGTSETDFLRFEEMARVGSFLEAECKLNFEGLEISDEHKQAISALLSASALLVECIGGKRRRGSGKCRLTIAGLDRHKAVDWLEKNKDAPDLPKVKDSNDEQEKKDKAGETANPDATTGPDTHRSKGDWVSVPLRLKLKQPISIAARTLGNVTKTLDYVPGTYLLPHITRKFNDTLQQVGEDCHELFASARLQILPATIEIKGRRGLPVPTAIFRHKTDGGFHKVKEGRNTVMNRFREEVTENTPQLKGYRNGYIEPVNSVGQLPSYIEVPLIVLTHNTVQDDKQRPTSEVGGVYSREAIDPVVTLRTELRLPRALNEKLKEKDAHWWTKLAGTCRLGVSSKDDYGAAEVEVLAESRRLVELPELNPGQTELAVWLLSDVLLRSCSLRPTTQADELMKELEALLGQELPANKEVKLSKANKDDKHAQEPHSTAAQTTSPSTPTGADEEQPEKGLLHSLIYTRRIESWQKSWGRPRPSLITLAAGSCVVFKLNGPADAGKVQEALRAIAADGIGERRGEGYGQVSFNSPLLTEKLNSWKPAAEQEETDAQTSNLPALVSTEQYQHTYEFAQLIEETAWRTALRRAVLRVAANADQRYEILGLVRKGDTKDIKEDSPPMSQLGALRTVLDRLQSKADRQHFKEWAGHLKKTDNRAKKWNKKRHRDDQSALEKVNRLVTQDDAVWQALCLKWEEIPTLTADAEKQLKEKLWAEAVRSLVDACIRAHRRATENKDRPQIGQ